MKYSKEEILNALHLIKDICGENGECFTCPFSKEGQGCLIDNRMPCEWELIDEEKWKVFK